MARTYEQMEELIRSKIAEHNGALRVGEDALRINPDQVVTNLRQEGCVTASAMKIASWELLQKAGCVAALAKVIATELRADGEPVNKTAPSVVRVLSMGDDELLRNYNPTLSNSPVARQLSTRSKEQPCIAFRKESDRLGEVHVEASVIALRAIALQQGRGTVNFQNELFELFHVGANPCEMAIVHPLFSGVLLGVDGADQFGIDWGIVDEPVRQFLMIAVELKEIVPTNDALSVSKIFRDVAIPEALKYLNLSYSKTRLAFERRQRENDLPRTMKTRPGSIAQKANPVGGKDLVAELVGSGS